MLFDANVKIMFIQVTQGDFHLHILSETVVDKHAVYSGALPSDSTEIS